MTMPLASFTSTPDLGRRGALPMFRTNLIRIGVRQPFAAPAHPSASWCSCCPWRAFFLRCRGGCRCRVWRQARGELQRVMRRIGLEVVVEIHVHVAAAAARRGTRADAPRILRLTAVAPALE